jgi:small subunit ribosomal protein S17
MDKTIVVKVESQFKHPLYKKIVRRHKKFKAHDEENTCNEGDTVLIQESKPISRDKRWTLVKVIERRK